MDKLTSTGSSKPAKKMLLNEFAEALETNDYTNFRFSCVSPGRGKRKKVNSFCFTLCFDTIFVDSKRQSIELSSEMGTMQLFDISAVFFRKGTLMDFFYSVNQNKEHFWIVAEKDKGA